MSPGARPRLELPSTLRSELFDRYYLVSSNATRPPLRVGVMLDDMSPIAFFAAILEQVARSNHSRLCAVVLNGAPSQAAPPRGDGRLGALLRLVRDRERRKKLAWTLYLRWDEKRFPATASLFRPVDCSPLFDEAERIVTVPLTSRFTHRFDEPTVRRLRELDLDVILRFGFNIIRGEILDAARYGIWSYHHGDNEYYRGGPPHFWELYEAHPCSGALLQVLREELDAGFVLDRVIAATEAGISVSRNRLAPYLASLHLVIRALHDLHEFGWDHLLERAPGSVSYQGKRRIYRTPSNREMAAFIGRRLYGSAKARLAAVLPRSRRWSIGFRPAAGRGSRRIPDSADGFRWLTPPRGCYYADPFVVRHLSRTWLFFERYDCRRRRGHIACAELGPDGIVGEVRVALEEPWHLSYPFVFAEEGEFFMIPEAAQSGKVTLYRAAQFPYRWVRERELFDFGLLDVTPLHAQGRYWFFAAARDPRAASIKLCLFHAPNLFEPWTWHPANPISADIRRARPAGAVFHDGSRLVRPAQDGAGSYGRAVRFLEIVKLTPTDYAETEVGTLAPPDGADGLHTFNSDGHFEVTDRLRRELQMTI